MLKRFGFEIDSGLYAMSCSRRVLDNLWEKVNSSKDPDFSILLVYATSEDEKGFAIMTHNLSKRFEQKDIDGLSMIVRKSL